MLRLVQFGVSGLFLFLVSSLGHLPVSIRALTGRLGGWCFSFIPTRDRAIAELQMNRFLVEEGGSCFLRKVYAGAGETVMESINLKPIIDDYRRRVSADWPAWNELRARQRPVLFLSAHTGNWDLLAACTVKLGYKVSVVGREANQPMFQRILHQVRSDYGVSTIWRGGSSGIKAIIDAFRKGESVGTLIDQDTKVASRMIPFFGSPAATPSSIVEIAKRYNALVAAAFIFRTGLNRFEIVIKELDARLPVDEILVDFNRTLCTLIRKHPSQWVWFHKRWRTLPTGVRLRSGEYLAHLRSLPRCGIMRDHVDDREK